MNTLYFDNYYCIKYNNFINNQDKRFQSEKIITHGIVFSAWPRMFGCVKVFKREKQAI